jgi:hypothetical protein
LPNNTPIENIRFLTRLRRLRRAPRPNALAGAGFATSHIAHGHAKRMRDGMRDAMVDASERLKRFRCSISTAAIKARQIKSVERGR